MLVGLGRLVLLGSPKENRVGYEEYFVNIDNGDVGFPKCFWTSNMQFKHVSQPTPKLQQDYKPQFTKYEGMDNPSGMNMRYLHDVLDFGMTDTKYLLLIF